MTTGQSQAEDETKAKHDELVGLQEKHAQLAADHEAASTALSDGAAALEAARGDADGLSELRGELVVLRANLSEREEEIAGMQLARADTESELRAVADKAMADAAEAQRTIDELTAELAAQHRSAARERSDGADTAAPDVPFSVRPEGTLRFPPPEEGSTEETVRLTLACNADEAAYFKIKTNAPNKYRVKPNSGFVGRGQEVSVAVALKHKGISDLAHAS